MTVENRPHLEAGQLTVPFLLPPTNDAYCGG